MMLRRRRSTNGGSAPWRRNSDEDESVSPRCVLDGYASTPTTPSSTTTPMDTSISAVATTRTMFPAAYTDPSTRRSEGPPPWKAVAEAWRCRAKRQLSARIPSLGPSMSSTLRRLASVRPRPAERDPGGGEEAAREFCVLKPSLRTFSLSELRRATGNFSEGNVVGRGGFARVYRGRLPGGELVAVKRLTAGRAAERVEGFLSELGHVVNVSHPNVARLVGVGVDGGEHLVFPFSRLGCLSGMLHGAVDPMPWAARHRVAVGTARGLEYLHHRCARRIVHRDIKPANILLMDDYEPLICDFGLARWMPARLTQQQVSVFEGTFGYVPPEYTTHGVFSEKTDVYALGVVLLELLTGRRAIVGGASLSLSLVAWARGFLDGEDEDGVPKMADPAMGGRYDARQLRDMAWAASLCTQASPDHRPPMSHVVQILIGEGPAAHPRGGKRSDQPGALRETDGCDAAGGFLDDLSRHKALAYEFDSESTSLAYIRHFGS